MPQLLALEDRCLPSTFPVLNLNDSGPHSLRAAVAAANANPGPDTITFADHLHGTIRLTSGALPINDSVTINGPGADQLAVSGTNASRVFELATSLNVTISGLTITHGSALDLAGGILNNGSNLTLTRDSLTQNVTSEGTTDTNGAQGGGLASLGGIVNITDCTITDNQALGGAVRRRPGKRMVAACSLPRALPRSATAHSSATWHREEPAVPTVNAAVEPSIPAVSCSRTPCRWL